MNPDQRQRIAWCGQCGNVSVDGLNFDETDWRGLLVCDACGAEGPFAYVQERALPSTPFDASLLTDALNRIDAEWPLKP